MADFWDEMSGAFSADSSVDEYLGGRPIEGSHFTSVRALAQSIQEAEALPLPVEAGTRVKFLANLGSVLSYEDIPDPKVEGSVVTVKTGSGPSTSMDGRVFVLWDDGKFRSIMAQHLRQAGVTSKRSATVRMVVSDLGDLSAFFSPVASGGDELVHKATKDLWSFRKDGEQFVIERLFNDNGKPLKV
jgi:hypothetical protein